MALDKNQKQMVIIGIMVLVLIFVAMDAMKGSKKKKPKKTDDASDAQPQAVPGAQAQPGTEGNKSTGNFMPPDRKILDLQLAKIAAKSNLRDPFFSSSKNEPHRRGSLVLKGISWTESGRCFALINDEIVMVGDTIADSQVVEIIQKSVTLEKEGQRYILVLEE